MFGWIIMSFIEVKQVENVAILKLNRSTTNALNLEFLKDISMNLQKLKKDSETLITQYLDEIKPTLKSVDENVIELSKNFKSVKVDVDVLKENKPKSFGKWISEKGKLAENTTNIFRFVL